MPPFRNGDEMTGINRGGANAPRPLAQRLMGGNLSVVERVGGTVLRPAGPWTPAVHALLRHLEAAGFDGAPRVVGMDGSGREILTYVEGEVPWPVRHAAVLGSDDAMSAMGRLLRRFHEAVGSFPVPSGAAWRFPDMEADGRPWLGGEKPIICHNDPGAWNLVVDGDRWALIDWDAAGPRPRLWDVAYAARGVIPISATGARHAGWNDPPDAGRRLRALADGYGLDALERRRLPDLVIARMASSTLMMRRRAAAGEEPWTTLWRSGHGAAWLEDLAWAGGQRDSWRRWMT